MSTDTELGTFIHDVINKEKHISLQDKRYIAKNFDGILATVSKNSHFKRLFLTWTSLNSNQRELLDEIALSKIASNYQFYVTLNIMLVVWEHIQNHYGAPGYEQEDKKEDLHQSDAEVLSKVDKIITWILRKCNDNVDESRRVHFQT